MINQKYHRTYVDCAEILEFLYPGVNVNREFPARLVGQGIDIPLTCCSTCATIERSPDTTSWIGSLFEWSGGRAIEILPRGVDGVSADWAANISALVCCTHVHTAIGMSRDQWFELARKVGAKPFFSVIADARRQNANYTPSVSRRVASPRTSRSDDLGKAKVYSCRFCSSPTTNLSGICKTCVGG